MRLLRLSLTLLTFSFFAVSCMKEKSFSNSGNTGNTGNTNTSKSIAGNWKFVSSGGTTSVIVEARDGAILWKMQTFLNFTSSNPKGFYTISTTEIKANNISYDYNGTLRSIAYMNNELLSDETVPMNSSITDYTYISPYRLIGNDSIFFSSYRSNTPSATSAPMGGRYKLEGNKLTITMNTSVTESVINSGLPAKQTTILNTNFVLEKQ